MLRRIRIITITAVAVTLLAAVAPVEKLAVCHAAGQAGTEKFVRIEVPPNDGGFPQGHYTEGGTPLAGHEDDYIIGADEECQTEATTTTTPTSTTSVVPSTTSIPTTTTPTSTSLPPSTTSTSIITTTSTTEPTTTTEPSTPTTTEVRVPVEVPVAKVSCGKVTVTGGPAMFQLGGAHTPLEDGTYTFDSMIDGDMWALYDLDGELISSGFVKDCDEPTVTQVTRPTDGGREFTPPTELPYTGTEHVALGLLAVLLVLAGGWAVRMGTE